MLENRHHWGGVNSAPDHKRSTPAGILVDDR
jgi:hypothetical protein